MQSDDMAARGLRDWWMLVLENGSIIGAWRDRSHAEIFHPEYRHAELVHVVEAATPAALAASPEVAALIREAEARGMERAAEMMRKPGDIWRTCTTTGGPSNDGQKWVHMSDFNELLRRADAIRAEAAALRGEKEPK